MPEKIITRSNHFRNVSPTSFINEGKGNELKRISLNPHRPEVTIDNGYDGGDMLFVPLYKLEDFMLLVAEAYINLLYPERDASIEIKIKVN